MASVWGIPGLTDFAKKAWAEGRGGNEISAMIAHTYRKQISDNNLTPPSRNGVIGKMNRECAASPNSSGPRVRMYERRSTQRRVEARQRRDRAAAINPRSAQPAARREASGPKFLPEPIDRVSNFVPPEANKIYQFADLDKPRAHLGEGEGIKHCRFIYGDPRQLFQRDNKTAHYCGCAQLRGTAYCDQHYLAILQSAPVAGRKAATKGEVHQRESEKELVT